MASLSLTLLHQIAERTLTWLLLAVLGSLLLIIGAVLLKSEYAKNIAPDIIQSERGHAYVATLPRPFFLYQLRSDARWPYKRSGLIIDENDKRLGPARSFHEQIRTIGRGAYSHWHRFLYFSTSDNSDPRMNGRIYAVKAPLFVHRGLIGLFLASAVASFFALKILWIAGSRHPILIRVRRLLAHPLARQLDERLQMSERRKLVTVRTAQVSLVLAAIAWINWIFLSATEVRPCLQPDSASYLGFSLTRSPLYPACTLLVHGLTGDIRWLIPLQLNAILLSLAMLGAVVGRLCDSRIWGLAFTLLSFTLTPVLLLSYMILTEALFAAFIALHIAMAGLFLTTRSWGHATLAGIFLAGVILMRPAGYSMLLALPLLIWLLRGEPRKVLVGVGGPVLVSYMAVSAFNLVKFGSFNAQSFGGMVLLSHVTYLIQPGDGAAAGANAETVERIASKVEPIAAPLRSLSFPDALWRQTSNRFNELAFNYTLPTVRERVHARQPDLQGADISKKMNEVSMVIALSVIRTHPWDYARHVLANYYGMWQGLLLDYGYLPAHVRMCHVTMGSMEASALRHFGRFTDLGYLQDPVVQRRFDAHADNMTPLRYVWELFNSFREIIRPLAFLLSIGFILLSLRALQDPLILLLSYASFQLNAYFGYMAAITAAIERYSVPFTPILLLIVFGTLFVGKSAFSRYSRRAMASPHDAHSH